MKRFSDTSRFDEEWYVQLSPELKVAWEYVWAKCDNAGVWNPSFRLADFAIGRKVKWAELIEKTGQIIVLPNGKWQVKGFCELQCGVQFSEASRPHQAVMALLRNHGITISDSLSIDYSRGTDTPQYKDKETDKDKDKDKDQKQPPEFSKKRGTVEELSAFCESNGLPARDGQALFEKWQGNGWRVGGQPILDWRSTIRSWKAHGYMPSQKNGHDAGAHRKAHQSKGQFALTEDQMPKTITADDLPDEP